jgi:hypothetical protein
VVTLREIVRVVVTPLELELVRVVDTPRVVVTPLEGGSCCCGSCSVGTAVGIGGRKRSAVGVLILLVAGRTLV